MQISLLAVIALLGLAAAAPSTSKRDHWKQKYDVGVSKRLSNYHTLPKFANS